MKKSVYKAKFGYYNDGNYKKGYYKKNQWIPYKLPL